MQETLESKLRDEKIRFDKLVTESQTIDAEIRKHESNIEKLREDDDEVLASADYPKKIGAIEKLLADVTARRGAFDRLLSRQRAVIDGIEGEIAANARARMLALVQPRAREFAVLLNQASTLAAGIMRDSAGHNLMPGDVFGGEDQTEHTLRGRVFADLLELQRYLSIFGKSAAA